MNYEENIKLAVNQIRYISQNGCGNIRCRKCILNKLCDHVAVHSQFYADQMIKKAEEYNANS